jgi:hypothetical protein
VHIVDAEIDARRHYHRTLTEIYIVLEGEGFLELDGEKIALRPLTAVMIKPGCRHRAIGRLKFLNVVMPAFDPADEWFDGARCSAEAGLFSQRTPRFLIDNLDGHRAADFCRRQDGQKIEFGIA